jgi:preprotein translocase subunit SecG
LFGFLLVLLLLVGLFMCVIVLLQAGKGGGLAAMGGGGAGSGIGGDNLIGGRQAATLLTKSTWISGGLFLFLALMLSVVSSRQAGPEGSILRGQIPAPAVTPTPVLPGTGAPAEAPGAVTPGAPAPQQEGAPPQP